MSDNENEINMEPNDIENPRETRIRLPHSPEKGDYGQFVAISPEEQPKPKNFPRKPSARVRRVLDLETGDSKEDFNVNTPPQNMYHTGPVPDPLPTDEDLEQALKDGVNVVNVVKDSICNSVSGCQLQGGKKRKRKRKRRTRKKKGGRFEKLALKIDEFNKRIADLEYLNEDTGAQMEKISSQIEKIDEDFEGYGRDIQSNSQDIGDYFTRLQRLEDAFLMLMGNRERTSSIDSNDSLSSSPEPPSYDGGRKRRTKKRRKRRKKKTKKRRKKRRKRKTKKR